MKPIILTEHPGSTDATQWYRASGPLAQMAKRGDIELRFSSTMSWGEIKAAHILFLLRPSLQQHQSVIESAKKLGTKVWVDYDDDLWEVPADNPMAVYYNSPGTREVINTCFDLADEVTVSTNFLLEKYGPRKEGHVTMVRNAVDDELLKLKPVKTHQQGLILWRGTATHFKDLMTYSKAIVEVLKDHPGKIAFLGYNPWFITEQVPDKCIVLPSATLLDYHAAVCALRPQLTIVPLTEHDFNKSKSNIAGLEATLAGSQVLAPDWEEWRQVPGFSLYKDKGTNDFLIKMSDMGRTYNEGWVAAARSELPLLSKANAYRRGIACSLMK